MHALRTTLKWYFLYGEDMHLLRAYTGRLLFRTRGGPLIDVCAPLGLLLSFCLSRPLLRCRVFVGAYLRRDCHRHGPRLPRETIASVSGRDCDSASS
jgi:hypothetical protein